jgi:hypothetical protein
LAHLFFLEAKTKTMQPKRFIFLFGICLCLLAVACSKSSSNTSGGGGSPSSCDGVNAKFAANVLPLIQTKCAINSGCHAAGASNIGGVLTTHAQISAKAGAIKSTVNAGTMPQTGSLTSGEKAILSCWVDAGALNN